MNDGDGFAVDTEALYAASLGLRRLTTEFNENPVRDVDAGTNFGHAHLAGVVEDFSVRWQRGVKNLITDVESIDRRLIDTLKTYQATDEAAAVVLLKIINGGSEVDFQE